MSDDTSPFPGSNIPFRRFATTNQTRYLKSKDGQIFGSISREFFFFFFSEWKDNWLFNFL